MTSYTQLTQVERYQIHTLKRVGFGPSAIAKALQRCKSTISRELQRNSGPRGYCPQRAQMLVRLRNWCKARCRIAEGTWDLVEELVKLDWSPEQISLWLAQKLGIRVSHEWIYLYIYKDKSAGGELHRHLRCQKKRRKRYGSNGRRGNIKDRVSIHERPDVVGERSRIGDWEIDTIIGKGNSGVLVSLTERKAKHVLIAKVPSRSAAEVTKATLALLEPIKDLVHTLTSDNGLEFSGHAKISKALGAKFYFADPYSSWQRGTNENANGLIRQYFPKQMNFSTITQRDLDFAMQRLNNRPRKCLAMQTPNQVLFGIKPTVALAS